MANHKHLGLLAALVLHTPISGAYAETPEVGAYLAMACASCHGPDGAGGNAIPALTGRTEAELFDTMKELQKPADGITIMPRILRAYDDADLKALASHYATVKP